MSTGQKSSKLDAGDKLPSKAPLVLGAMSLPRAAERFLPTSPEENSFPFTPFDPEDTDETGTGVGMGSTA